MADEYIRKEDAIDTVSKACFELRGVFGRCEDALKALPPADVAKIVRCKNCKYRSYDEVFCCYWCEHEGMVREVKPDFYCGYGEE